MMSFLDLSTASEEERRLINEILSDTSVVNFAEPKSEQNQQQQQVQPQLLNKQHHQQHNQHSSSDSSQSIKITNRLQNKQQHGHNLTDQNHHHHHSHQNHNINHNSHLQNNVADSQANNTAPHLDYVPNNIDTEQEDQRHQVPPVIPVSELHNTSPILATAGVENNLNSNDIGASNHLNNNLNYKNQPTYPIAPQDNSLDTTQPTATNNVAAKTTPSFHSSLPNTLTTNSVTQSSTTVPPHSVATQMPPPMAGDMNSVMGMDMTSPQPTGYAIPNMAQTHSYGPPPPPHHVYGGPPIFQPYPTHYIIPYNIQPYPMPFVMPPTSSVVPNRQVSTQSSQPPNAQINHRSHSHHPRPNKPKEFSKQPAQMHSLYMNHDQHQDQQHHQPQQQIGSDIDINPESSSSLQRDPPSKTDDFNSSRGPADDHDKIIVTETPSDNSLAEQPQNTRSDENLDKLEHVEVTAKISSDESSDTQLSQESSNQEPHKVIISEKSKSPKEECNNSQTEQPDYLSLEENDENEKTKNNQVNNKASSGPWGSASSKSWASLFKADGTAYRGTSLNGEIEHNTIVDSDNSEGEGAKNNSSSSIRLENTMKNTTASTKEQRSQDAARRALDKMGPKLAQKINSISLKHSLPLLRPRGFINKGNGCYINSSLQALIACPPFYNLMKEIGDLRAIKRENSCTPILDSFADLFLNFPPLDASKKNKQQPASTEQKLQMNYLQADAIEPKCIYNVLGNIKSECLRGAQEDAEEFLSSVLNGLHEEMIGLSDTLQYAHENSSKQNGHLSDAEDTTNNANDDENLWREVGSKNRSLPIRAAKVINTPIQEIFGGSLFSIRTAGKDRCGHRSPFFDLQLDISSDNVKSLQDAIKSFTATETIQDFYCSKTKQKLDAQRRTSLDQLPPILILHLKQFIYTQDHGLKKIMKRIEYPIDFELPESCLHDKNSDKSLRNSRTYKLLAVVYHEGKEAVKGHYLTDVYHIGSSQWIRCDDSNLKVVPAPRIENPDSSRTPYLLFYRRLNTLGPRQSNSHDSKKKN